MEVVLKNKGGEDVFGQGYPFYSIIEVASNNDPDLVTEDSERLLEFMQTVTDNMQDGIVPRGEQ
jgi:hypothetical protein